jgi:hypothetical protein
MAKGIAMNGMLRGKLGGVVYSRVNGEQISRVKAESVKNPKTSAQMAQRAIFATATHAYSIMKPIVDHSREGVQYGAKTQQKFMQDALALLRARAAADDGNFLIPNVAALMANPFVVSKGSLTSPIHIAYDSDSDFIKITSMNNPSIDDEIRVTAKSFCDALGINKGDQITLVAITRDENQPVLGEYAGREYRRNKFIYARITVKNDANDEELVYNPSDVTFGSAVIVEGFGDDKFSTDGASNEEMKFGASSEMLAFACIRSSKIDGKWLRSTESLTLADEMLLYNFNNILPAWTDGGTKLEFDSTRYLNNAENEEVVTTPTLTKVAARVNQGGEITISNVAALSKGGYAGTPIVDNGDDKHPYQLKANGHVLKLNAITVVDGYITKAFAEKQMGTTIIVDQA